MGPIVPGGQVDDLYPKYSINHYPLVDVGHMAQTGNSDAKYLHDLMLESQPVGAVHVACDLCSENSLTMEDTVAESAEDIQAKIDQAVAEAVALKDARISELEAVSTASAHEAELASLKSDLDVAATAKAAADARAEAAEAELASYKEEVATAAVREATRAERVAQVEALGVPAERIEARADDYAAMSPEQFSAVLEDLEAVKATVPATATADVPTKTAMVATAETKSNRAADYAVLHNLRARGIPALSI